MLLKKATEREWTATPYAGIERSLLRNHEAGGRSSLVRLNAGARFPRHTHEAYEEVLALKGTLRIGDVEMHEGDYLYTAPGEEHDVVAVTDAMIYVASAMPTPVIEK